MRIEGNNSVRNHERWCFKQVSCITVINQGFSKNLA